MLPAGVGRQHDALAFHTDGDAVVEDDPGESDPGYVARGDQPGQQVQLAVRCAAAPGIQHSLGLERVAGLRGHDHADPGQLVGHEDISRQWTSP